MARPQLSARVDQQIFETVVRIETETQTSRSAIVEDLIRKGLSASGESVPTVKVVSEAKKFATETTHLKTELGKWKNEAIQLRKQLAQNGNTTVEYTKSHPLLTDIEKNGITMTNGEDSVTINSLSDLLDFISNQKS